MQHKLRWSAPALVFFGLCCNLYAVDGIILIDQNRALAGNVTPGDAPGFPVTISQSGSYRLAGNLTVPDANTTAIQITADNVTIDLNGFSLIGPTVCTPASASSPVTSCSPTGTGVGVNGGSHRDIKVVNGGVRGMGDHGILIFLNAVVREVQATSNGFTGINIGFNGVVSGSVASNNGGSGIRADLSTVSGNTTNNNKVAGLNIACPSSVVGNTANSNGGANLSTSGVSCALANNAAP